MKSVFTKFIADKCGGLALPFALTLTVVITGAGAAYDYSNIAAAKMRLQDSVDTAALAGAIVARQKGGERKQTARSALNENIELISGLSMKGQPSITIDDTAKEITVSATASYKTSFLGFVGKNTVSIKASSTTGFAIEQMNPLSVYLVLDVSGSMSWASADGTIKIDALKNAVDDMFYTLYSTSEDPGLLNATIRTGYASYASGLGATRNMSAGYSGTVADVKDLNAVGGTNSAPGFQYAYDQLKADMPATNWSGFLIFMTDGDNNDLASDVATLDLCAQAKADNITIYTVAFEAPKKGEDLLKACAQPSGKFYKSDNANDLNDAFRDIGRSISQSVIRIKD